ncbi:hypothetical protein PRIPAC_90455 [Pristionchus pacificus]|uniref:E3 ubiquitin-protein ligase RNF170 n=1 Tax=Pristionchus pacificus TaxID=54126 RepID=A0A2A6CVF0_PRIPA|nr:hypothetical protein PRIPAC_90455 [Pristionchus pacificus]|eukprot:PDM82202.1 zinc finger protein [Pristionchus pacificus]
MEEPDVDHEVIDERMLEGVSNEVVLFIVSLGVLLVSTVVFFYYRHKSRPVPAIHPSLENEIREFREVYERVNAPLPDEDGVRRLIDGRSRSDGSCPICYDSARNAVLTDCGHSFCCSCVIGYWQHSASPIAPVNCAVCRAPVTMLLPISWPARETIEDEQAADALHEANMHVDDYNRRFSGEREWYSVITDIPVLIPYLLNNFTANGAFIGMFRIRAYITIVCIIMYVLCPLDLVSENIYGVLGFLDDAFMALVALVYICVALRTYMQRRGEVPLED